MMRSETQVSKGGVGRGQRPQHGLSFQCEFNTSQSYNLLPAPVRRMSMYAILFGSGNTREKQTITQGLGLWLFEPEFETVFETANSDRYNFLIVQINERRFLKNFETMLLSQYDL
jgi:hypothetical protein